ncbi:MAG: hypothetical protein ACP5LD_12690, partial [Desulfomonilaceae bacterium]
CHSGFFLSFPFFFCHSLFSFVIPFFLLSFPFFFCHSHESGNPFFIPGKAGRFRLKRRESFPPRFSPFRRFQRDRVALLTSAAEPPTVALAVSSENRYNPQDVCPRKQALET